MLASLLCSSVAMRGGGQDTASRALWSLLPGAFLVSRGKTRHIGGIALCFGVALLASLPAAVLSRIPLPRVEMSSGGSYRCEDLQRVALLLSHPHNRCVLLTEKTPVPALICYPVFWFNFSAIRRSSLLRRLLAHLRTQR